MGMADNGEGAGVLAGASCSSKAGMAALRRAIHSLDKPMPHWTQTGIRQSTGVTHRLGRKTPKDESVHISKKKEHEMETKVLPEVCQTPSGAWPIPGWPSPPPWHHLRWAVGTKCTPGLKLWCWQVLTPWQWVL